MISEIIFIIGSVAGAIILHFIVSYIKQNVRLVKDEKF